MPRPKSWRKTGTGVYIIDTIAELGGPDPLPVLIIAAVGLLLLTIVASFLLSPKSRRKKLEEAYKQQHIGRPWRLLALFQGSLYCSDRNKHAPAKETRLAALHRLVNSAVCLLAQYALSGTDRACGAPRRAAAMSRPTRPPSPPSPSSLT